MRLTDFHTFGHVVDLKMRLFLAISTILEDLKSHIMEARGCIASPKVIRQPVIALYSHSAVV